MSTIGIITSVLAVGAAIVSAYYALRAQRNFRFSVRPVLIPHITDVTNPNRIKITIVNEGNGIAENIWGGYLDDEQFFDTALLPRREAGGQRITWEFDINFRSGQNPLFDNPRLEIGYEDLLKNKLKTVATFKPDVVEKRAKLGHVDKNFVGYHFEYQ